MKREIAEIEGRNENWIHWFGHHGQSHGGESAEAGALLVVFNRTRDKAESLLGSCGKFSESPAELARQVDVLFTMLAHPTQSSKQRWDATDF